MPDGSFDLLDALKQGAAGKFSPAGDSASDAAGPSVSADGMVHMTVRPQRSTNVPQQVGDGSALSEMPFNLSAALKAGANGKFEYTPPPPEPGTSTGGGIVNNLAAGANDQIIAGVGLLPNVAQGAINLPIRGLNAMGAHLPLLEGSVGTTDWLKSHSLVDLPSDVMNAGLNAGIRGINSVAGTHLPEYAPPHYAPIAPNPDDVPVNGFMEQAARGVGGAVASLPMMGLGGAGAAVALPGGVARRVAQSVAEMPVVPAIAPVAAGAVAGQAAEAGVPDWLKPYANLAGNLVGGVGFGAMQQGAGGLGRAVQKSMGEMGIGTPAATSDDGLLMRNIKALPSWAGVPQRQTIAGRRVTGQQADAAAGQISHALGPEGTDQLFSAPEQIVPGSQPTLAQLAPTPGTVALEQAHRTASPDAFLARGVEQNTARLGQIAAEGGGEGASSGAVSPRLEAMRGDINAAGNAAVGAQGARVTAATDALGGQQSPQAIGQAIRGVLSKAYDEGHPAVSRLWQAIDPDGKLALNVAPVKAAADGLLKDINPAVGDALTEPEARIIGGARRLPSVISFSDLSSLRSNIGTAERALRAVPGNDQALRRLGILKGSVDESIAQAAEGRAMDEAAAVSSGAMTPEETMLSRLNSWGMNERASNSADLGAGDGGGQVSGQLPGGNAVGTSGSDRAAGQSSGGDGYPPGTQSVPREAPSPLTANFGSANAADYAAARNATLQEKQTFRTGPVGEVLRPGAAGADFRVSDSDVPRKFFSGGPREAQDVAAYLKAAGGSKEAAKAGQDYLASDLRQQGIVGTDGLLDPGKFARWQSRHTAAIDALDRATDTPLASRFKTAVEAQKTYDEVTAAHKAALDEFDKGAARHFIGADPMKAVASALGQGKNPTQTFVDLVRMVRPDPAAMNGLKKAVTDYIAEKLTSTVPAGDGNDMLKAATFRTWMETNRGPLKVLFGGQGMQNLEAVAADLRRQASATQAVTGSATASRLMNVKSHGLAGHAHAQTALVLIAEHAGEMIAHGLGQSGIIGGAIGIGATITPMLAHSLKQAGVQTTNDLVGEALLHPSLARELMGRVRPDGGIAPMQQRRIAAALQAVSASQATRATTERRQ